MKSVFISFLLLVVGTSAHAICWVTPDGEARYKVLELIGCEDDVFSTCVNAETHSGRKYSEKFIARGCAGPSCHLALLESEHFTYVLRSSPSNPGLPANPVDRVYLTDRSEKILYICSGL